jgi:hypothetical protein
MKKHEYTRRLIYVFSVLTIRNIELHCSTEEPQPWNRAGQFQGLVPATVWRFKSSSGQTKNPVFYWVSDLW